MILALSQGQDQSQEYGSEEITESVIPIVKCGYLIRYTASHALLCCLKTLYISGTFQIYP